MSLLHEYKPIVYLIMQQKKQDWKKQELILYAKHFGYHFYKLTKDVAMLQKLFNHSSPSITLAYIGIEQDEIDEAYDEFEI